MARALRVAARELAQLPHHHQVLRSREEFVEGGVLTGHADDAADRTGVADHVEAADPARSAVGRRHRGEHPDGRGLPGTVRPQHAEDAPFRYRQVDVNNCHLLAVALVQPFCFDHGPPYLPYGKLCTYRSSSKVRIVNDTRERILAVAQELFIEQGYDGTSLREIADRLGFTKAALYYHFRSKDEILVALIEPGTGLVGEFLERLMAADGVEAWADALAWMIDQMFDHLEFFKLIERNRNTVAALHEHLQSLTKHLDMHVRVEEAVRRATSDLREQVRMVAAVGAVTGFDDWAPRLLAEAPPDQLRAELIAATRAVLELPARHRQPTG